jgi:transposase
MSMGERKSQRQDELFISHEDLPKSQGHPFYQRLNEILRAKDFDRFTEQECQRFYASVMGRPGTPPGVYFRMLLVGYFEGIDSERGIAWRIRDSLSLREFLGYGLADAVPDHSTLSRTRRLIDVETHGAVFAWILRVLTQEGLVGGKTLGVDSTTLEANAALRSIVNRKTHESYEEFLTRLAKASGIETPTRQDLARMDRHRKGKGSNQQWEHPHDPDARITKMKDGRTHLAHKQEHAVDMDSGVVVAVTIQAADRGDTQTLEKTVDEAARQLIALREDPATRDHLDEHCLSEVVLDKGYHSNDSLQYLQEMTLRSYVSEPDRGRRCWKNSPEAQAAVYANRRRIRGQRGRRLLRRRGEMLERPFAHCLETGGMRRVHLRKRENIHKRVLIHVGGYNLGVLMRKLTGVGTPRTLQRSLRELRSRIGSLLNRIVRLSTRFAAPLPSPNTIKVCCHGNGGAFSLAA